MVTVTTCREIADLVAGARARGERIGFVPTMGALHAGHAALVRAALDRCAFVVVSVFVNPTQFGPGEDFDRYPRTLDADRELLAETGSVAVLFAPSAHEVYGNAAADGATGGLGRRTSVVVGHIADRWEGSRRPGHFDGVALVVTKLLGIVRPDLAFFGEKDYQQLCVVRQVVEDLKLRVEIVGCPTVREPDGLALSSRNRYLTESERSLAPAIFAALTDARTAWRAGADAAAVQRLVVDHLRQRCGNDLVTDYVGVVDGATLEPLEATTTLSQIGEGARPRILVAAQLGGTHLLDNIEL